MENQSNIEPKQEKQNSEVQSKNSKENLATQLDSNQLDQSQENSNIEEHKEINQNLVYSQSHNKQKRTFDEISRDEKQKFIPLPVDSSKTDNRVFKNYENPFTNPNPQPPLKQSIIKDYKQQKPPQPKLICNICIEELTDIKAVIDCNHYYCLECIKHWAENENTCPLCKKEFMQIRVKKIVNNSKLSKRKPNMLSDSLVNREQKFSPTKFEKLTINQFLDMQSTEKKQDQLDSTKDLGILNSSSITDKSKLYKVRTLKNRNRENNQGSLNVSRNNTLQVQSDKSKGKLQEPISGNVDDSVSYAHAQSFITENDLSEEVNVIEVEPKKQRVNDNYLELNNEQLRQIALEYDDEDYYDDEDGEYDSEENSQIAQHQPAQQILLSRADQNNQIQDLIDGLPADLFDSFALNLISYFCMTTSNARLESWNDVLIIPESMKLMLVDIHRDRLSRLPDLYRRAIIKFCQLNPETFGVQFPFISPELVLEAGDPEPLYVHISDLRLQQRLYQELGGRNLDFLRGFQLVLDRQREDEGIDVNPRINLINQLIANANNNANVDESASFNYDNVGLDEEYSDSQDAARRGSQPGRNRGNVVPKEDSASYEYADPSSNSYQSEIYSIHESDFDEGM
eukprot:403337819